MKIVCPCRHCEERQVGCHSNCEKYATYCRENAIRNSTIKGAKAEAAEMREYVIRAIHRHRKTKGKTHLGWNTGG